MMNEYDMTTLMAMEKRNEEMLAKAGNRLAELEAMVSRLRAEISDMEFEVEVRLLRREEIKDLKSKKKKEELKGIESY